MNPLVSIIIPSYNHAEFLGKALKSVQNQSYSNWEVIVVDNHSSDTTDSVLKEQECEKIHVYKIHNGGIIAVSRNFGIQQARGEWIAFLDSDDWWDKDKLRYCIGQVTSEIDFVYHDMMIYNGDTNTITNKVMRSRFLKKPVLKDLIIRGNCIINSSVLVRKSLLEMIKYIDERSELVTAEDYHCWLKIASLSDRFLYVNKVLGFYTFHRRGMSKKDVIQQSRTAIKDFLPELSEVEQQQAEAFVRYFKLVSSVNVLSIKNIISDTLFCLKFGRINVKLKSIFIFLKLNFYRNV